MPPTPLPSTGVGASTVGGGGNWEKPVTADRVTQRRGSIVLVDGCQVLFPMSRVQVRSRVPFVVHMRAPCLIRRSAKIRRAPTPFLHFSLQSSHLNICYYHQDLH
jgi:hypothetical protein